MRYFTILLFLFVMVCFSIAPKYTLAQDLYNLDRIQELHLRFERNDWEQALDSLKQLGTKQRLVADAKLNGLGLPKVGVRFKGNSSYNNARNVFKRKLPFNIKADSVNKQQRFGNQHITLKLANGFRDPSMLREVLSYEIASKYMVAPKANFVNVYVNGKHYGLYTSVETIDETFMAKHFGTPDSVLIKCDVEDRTVKPKHCPKVSDRGSLEYIGADTLCYMNIYETESGAKGLHELQRFTYVLNKTPDKIEQYLNVDAALWMLAFNNVLVNLDSYSGKLAHNYYLAKDKSGRFVPVLWDLNLSFGGFTIAEGEKSLSLKEMQELSLFIHFKNSERPLIQQLLNNPRYRKIYLAHVRTILDENFSNGQYLERARTIQKTIDMAVKSDENKFYSYQSFLQNVNQTTKAGEVDVVGLQELMSGRVAYFNQHPLFQQKSPEISKPIATKKPSNQLHVSVSVKGGTKVWLAYRYDTYSPFQYVELFDDGAHNDGAAADGQYASTIDSKAAAVQYFIYAENDKTASLSPARAEREFYTVQ